MIGLEGPPLLMPRRQLVAPFPLETIVRLPGRQGLLLRGSAESEALASLPPPAWAVNLGGSPGTDVLDWGPLLRIVLTRTSCWWGAGCSSEPGWDWNPSFPTNTPATSPQRG